MAHRPNAACSPVPSITLQITKKDGERFLNASHLLASQLEILQEEHRVAILGSDNENNNNEVKTKPLHEMLFDAAQKCQHPFVSQFLDRMTSFVESSRKETNVVVRNQQEIQAATLVFHNSDKTTKLRHLFSILATDQPSALTESAHTLEEEKKDDSLKEGSINIAGFNLNVESSVRLFRTVLMAISCCVHTPEHPGSGKDCNKSRNSIVVDGEPSSFDKCSDTSTRPRKKIKMEERDDATATTMQETLDDDFGNACQSPSWDSSLATLRDEDDKPSHPTNNLLQEIDEIARYAAEELFIFARNKDMTDESIKSPNEKENPSYVDFATFGDWYNTSGKNIVPWLELLHHSKWKPSSLKKENLSSSKGNLTSHSTPTVERDPPQLLGRLNAMTGVESPIIEEVSETSRTLVSFDFNGSGSPTPLLINISEDNLLALQALVSRTNLINCSAKDMCKKMLDAGTTITVDRQEFAILRKHDFEKVLKRIIPSHLYNHLSAEERKCFDESFHDFFSCFEGSKTYLQSDEVDLKEFTVGFCFFCSGNKSNKLLTGFELVDLKLRGFLNEDQLSRYLQSYLTMLVAMSLLMPMSKRRSRRILTERRKKELRLAVESGAKWTLGHFLKSSGQSKNEYTFECFANWYSAGGYNIAPWLELLDLKKVMSLIGESSSPLELPPLNSVSSESFDLSQPRTRPRDRVSSLRRHHSSRQGPRPEVLFTFPLGSRRSLVVLREDATYVKGVVERLGLLTMKPDFLWNALFKAVEKRRKPAPGEVAVYVDTSTFVQSMKEVCPTLSKKRTFDGSYASVEETLANFYQCFDIEQCDRVALDELMGGLTLLCGGKKSTKLAFAFSIFDTRPGLSASGKKDRITHSLSGEDLFLFLRSILIVTFSTCRQSLDMTDEIVGRCIADTANMICNDVMRHQWETKQLDRLDFDEFGQWYNDGGYERAPWLELLDLNKWVLLDSSGSFQKELPASPPLPSVGNVHRSQQHTQLHEAPDPPPEDSLISQPLADDTLDNSFLDEIDSMDEMDMILMQSSSVDRDELKITKSFSYSHTNSPPQIIQPSTSTHRTVNPLKFHLVTTDEHGGYMLSLSPDRISHLRRLLESSGLHNLDAETACNQILSKGSNSKLTKSAFDSAMSVLLKTSTPGDLVDEYSDRTMQGVLNGMFDAFDHKSTGEVNSIEVACGFTVLCRGKKSDKLEFAFEVLDKKKRGRLSRNDMKNYLQSFLTVLLSIAFSPSLDNDPLADTLSTMDGTQCDRSTLILIRAVHAGADWAASLAFRDFDNGHGPSNQRLAMSFDDFASWYTRVGYSSIPWLELLDLQKWAMVPDTRI